MPIAGLPALAIRRQAGGGSGHAWGRLVIALAFVAGTAASFAVVATLLIAALVDNVPVLPAAIVIVLAGGVLGSIAAAAASQRWWGFVLGLMLGFWVGAGAAAAGRWALGRIADGSPTWGLQPFDAQRWASARVRDDGFHPRGKMVAALLLGRQLQGRSRDEVRTLLGTPDCDVAVPADAWAIGSWTGFQIAADCLVIAYGSDDRVAIARATTVKVGELPRSPLSATAQVQAYADELREVLRDALAAMDVGGDR